MDGGTGGRQRPRQQLIAGLIFKSNSSEATNETQGSRSECRPAATLFLFLSQPGFKIQDQVSTQTPCLHVCSVTASGSNTFCLGV